MFPAAARWAIWPQSCKMDALLYLRNLRKETDGDRQGEAEGQQAHKAVDGQHQPAVSLQEPQPACAESQRKKECASLTEPVPEDDCGLFLDAVKSIMFSFQGSYFVQLVGGRIGLNLWDSSSSGFTQSQKCCFLLF